MPPPREELTMTRRQHKNNPPAARLRRAATAAVDALLTTHQQEVGTRLAIKQEITGKPERDLGGRGREPAIEAVMAALKPHMPSNV
jgi:hypothetical protein